MKIGKKNQKTLMNIGDFFKGPHLRKFFRSKPAIIQDCYEINFCSKEENYVLD